MAEPRRIKDLPAETLELIRHYRYDILIEKQELWSWEYSLHAGDVELLNIEGLNVLLPVEKKNHPNISVLRFIVSEDKETLTLFLSDTTYYQGSDAGVVAVCDRVPGEDWYIAVLYHSCRTLTGRELVGAGRNDTIN